MDNFWIINRLADQYKTSLEANGGRPERARQIDTIVSAIIGKVKAIGPINIIETGASQSWQDGMMGTFFANIALVTGGKMWVVDIDPIIIAKSKTAFAELGLEFVEFFTEDSVQFLKRFDEHVDIVHLDSWDLDLRDSLPSALHGWREFEAIEAKLGAGAIVIVDDNYLDGTWVNINEILNGQLTEKFERFDVTMPCAGKGAHIYWWVKQDANKWSLLGDHYHAGNNIKIICQKEV
jgi:hypothetical protein